MPTLTIKNFPEELYSRLKRQAEINRRSLNSEVILCIERAVGMYRIRPEAHLAEARRLRIKTVRHPITDDEFTAAKRMNRS